MWVILKVKSFVDFTFLRESSVGEGFLKASDSQYYEKHCAYNSVNHARFELHMIFSIGLHCLVVYVVFHGVDDVVSSFFGCCSFLVHQPFRYFCFFVSTTPPSMSALTTHKLLRAFSKQQYLRAFYFNTANLSFFASNRHIHLVSSFAHYQHTSFLISTASILQPYC